MHVEHTRWYSPACGRDMDILVLGHAGARVLVFPTTGGTHREWVDRHMHEVLGDHLENGWIQMFCVDQLLGANFLVDHLHPGHRAWCHLLYDRYVKEEVLPFTQWKNPNPFVITTGASSGAYLAAVFGLRHPHAVNRIIGMSGLYDMKRLTGGYSDENVYAMNPADFMRHEHDPGRLEAFRRQDIILAVGRTDSCYDSNAELSGILWDKGIGNALRVWDGWAHDWPFWQKMIRLYIGGHD